MDREKIIRGLAACMPQTEADAAIGCDGCPYNGHPCGGNYQDNDHVNLPVRMIEDIRALLKALDVTPEELERLKKCRHKCKIDCLLKEYDRVKEERDALLKAQEPSKLEIKHAISNVDIPKGVDEEQFFAVLSQQYAALAKLYGEDVPTYSPS